MKATFYGSVLLAVLLSACQSAPPKTPEAAAAPAAPAAAAPAAEPREDPSRIAGDREGFSPKAPVPADTLRFALHFGMPRSVEGWTLRLLDEAGSPVRTVEGGAADQPPTWNWDGQNDQGRGVAQGRYRAELTVRHGGQADPEVVSAAPVTVDVEPASGSIAVENVGDGYRIRLSLAAGGASIATWRLGVIHPDGRRFIDFINENHPQSVIDWNGRAENNARLEAGTTYRLELQIIDVYSLLTTITGTLETPRASEPAPTASASVVSIQLNGAEIGRLALYFPPYSADWTAVAGDLKQKNNDAFDALVAALPPNARGTIRIVGHANQVLWKDPAAAAREQAQVLLPLSRSRAEAVAGALTARGVDRSRFAVEGVGAEGNVAPFSDAANVWKNRRVEFQIQDSQP